MLISTQKQMICQLVYPDHRDEYFAGLLSFEELSIVFTTRVLENLAQCKIQRI